MEIIRGIQPKPVKGVIYGPEGVGKSSLGKDFPKPLFIDVEGGTSRLDVARTPRPTSWAHLRQIVADIAKDPQGFQTLVIDTADWAERLSIRQVCAENGASVLGKNAEGKKDFGVSYNQLAEVWSSFLTQLEADFIDTGKMHVIFLAHSTTKKFELPEEEGQFDRYELSLEKKVAPLLKGWCDLMLFVNYRTIVVIDEKTKTAKGSGGTRRMMFSEHTAAYDAKNRDGLPREMDLGYAPIAKCFAGLSARPALPPAPAPAASPAPVAPTTTTAPALAPQHQSLLRMMQDAGINYDQVITVLAERGRYPLGTPLENIDPAFIDGWICKHWPKIVEMATATATSGTAAA